jgi:hypothetical protein
LYDLSHDEHESHNLAGNHPDIVNRLRDRLLGWANHRFTL